jgi:hypothetical protein
MFRIYKETAHIRLKYGTYTGETCFHYTFRVEAGGIKLELSLWLKGIKNKYDVCFEAPCLE